jgi:phage baseplate assembly protein W
MATLTNINNPVWSMSTKGYGVVVEGLSALIQALELTIKTSRGSDPLRPDFGSRVYQYIDKPSNIAIPNIKREIIEAVDIWEKRVQVVGIGHYLKEPGNLVFEILFKVVDEDIIERLLFDLIQGSFVGDNVGDLILQAYYPPNPNGYRYTVKMERNGSAVFPSPDPSGYETLADLFKWVQSNWFFFGKWYQQIDRITCYMKADGITSASLSIEVLPIVRFEAKFPALSPGQVYKVQFLANGVDALPVMPETFITPGAVLVWAQTFWGDYATWLIEYEQTNGNTVFSDEFSDEFDVPATGYKLIGISNIEGFTGELTIITV